MCVNCGEVISSNNPETLTKQMLCHFANTWRPADSGCKAAEPRHKSFFLAGPRWDHGLDCALFHTQRKLERAQQRASEQAEAAARLATEGKRSEIEGLRSQLRRANDRADQLAIEKGAVERQLQDALADPGALAKALVSIAGSSVGRKRKLAAFLHPDNLDHQLTAAAKRTRDKLGL